MLDLLFGAAKRRVDSAWGDTDSGLWHHGYHGSRRRTQAGVVVDEALALTYSACWCATRIISEPVASLPLITYEREADEGRKRATELPIYDILASSPNPLMGSIAFRDGRTVGQVNWGNGFAEISRDRYGQVDSLWPVHSSRVRPSRVGDIFQDGAPVPQGHYVVKNNDGTETVLEPENMLHIPGAICEDGIWGKGVVSHARETLGYGIGAERHAATTLGAGNLPRAVVTGVPLKESSQRQEFRNEWKEIHGSPDSGEIAILGIGADIKPLSFNNRDAQFLEGRVNNIKEIARWYNIPVAFLQEYEKAGSFSKSEMDAISFVIYSLLPWLRRWEEQLMLKLLTPEQRKTFFIEFLVSGLLRGDLKTRMEAYRTALLIGLMTINECRRLENWRSIGPCGDVNYVPLNMTTAQAMALAPVPGTDVADDDDLAAEMTEPDLLEDSDGGTEANFDGWTRRQLARLQDRAAGKKLRRQSRTLALPAPVAVVEAAVPASPPPAPTIDLARIRRANVAMLEGALSRMCRRVAGDVRRAAGQPGKFLEFLEALPAAHFDAVYDAVAPAVRAVDALTSRDTDAVQLVRAMLAGVAAGLLEVSGQAKAGELEAAVAAWCEGKLAELPAAMAREVLGEAGKAV